MNITPSHSLSPIAEGQRRDPVVRYAPSIYEKMLASVGAFPPEHYAILGGHLHDPFRITDFQPMAPLGDSGKFRNSSSTVTLDGPRIEYYANTSLYPFNKYILGIMHSHPGDMTTLSDGVRGSGQGDIPSMRAQLEAAVRMGDDWQNFIAPIVTRPGSNPTVTTWIVRLDKPRPILAETVWEETEIDPTVDEAPLSLDEEIIDLLLARPDIVDGVLRHADRLKLSSRLRSHRVHRSREADQAWHRMLKSKGP